MPTSSLSGEVSGGQLSVTEKVGYSLGDAAANFVFQVLMVFQLSFYTDTFGLTAAAAGTLLLVARVADAFFDPAFGILADRTVSRWGKFRPWIIATAVPYGIMAVVAFSTPSLSYTGKLIYAYATYLGLMLVYSANNLPYSALSGVLTGDQGERTSVSSYRFMAAMTAAFVVQAIAPKMLEHFSHGPAGHYDPRAYQIVMGIFGVLSVAFFAVTFATTRERIVPAADQHASIGRDLANLTKNGPWLALFGVTLLVFVTLSMRGGLMKYYFQYFVGRDDLFWLFNAFGLGANLIGIPFSKPLAMRFGKRNVFAVGLAVTTVLTAAFAVLPATAVVPMFALETVRQLAYGTTIPLLWAMMADVADYSEWTTGRRATGIVFSAIVFGLKAGLGFGGAIGGWLLARYGYVANAVQTPRALDGIRLTSSLFAAIPFFLSVIALAGYRITKRLETQISDDLAARRAGTASPAAAGALPVVEPQAVGLAEAP